MGDNTSENGLGFGLETLLGLPASTEILVTKMNPVHWRDNQSESDRYFQGAEELSKSIRFGNFDKMLVIQTPSVTALLSGRSATSGPSLRCEAHGGGLRNMKGTNHEKAKATLLKQRRTSTQDHELKQYARHRNWAVQRVYTDHGFSDASEKRPAWARASSLRLWHRKLVATATRLSICGLPPCCANWPWHEPMEACVTSWLDWAALMFW